MPSSVCDAIFMEVYDYLLNQMDRFIIKAQDITLLETVIYSHSIDLTTASLDE